MFDHLESADVFDILDAIRSMVVAVVFHGDQDVFPAHVQIRHNTTEFIADRNLGLRRRKPAADQQQA